MESIQHPNNYIGKFYKGIPPYNLYNFDEKLSG